MSYAHAYTASRDPVSPSARSLGVAIVSLRLATADVAQRLIAGFRLRRTMGGFSRLSDHRLRDMGFERDWDGSILPIVR